MIWRRAFDIAPPELEITDERFPANDPRYNHLATDVLPKTEVITLKKNLSA
mgnify:CR=1 FL=1